MRSAPVLLLLACRCPRPASVEPAHFEEIGPLRHATITADLEAVRALAPDLDGGVRTAGAGAAGAEAEADLHSAAGLLMIAVDAREAGEGLAAVAAACGACHRAEGVELALPALGHGVALGHGRAADALWWSLLAGEPALAEPALRALAASPITAAPDPRGEWAAEVRRTAAAGDARETLATMFAHCTNCHEGGS